MLARDFALAGAEGIVGGARRCEDASCRTVGRTARALAAMSTLSRLQSWYARQCNGDWEHSQGVAIDSCDNPGWWVKINLSGTKLERQPFPEIRENVDASRHAQGPRWLNCRVEELTWHGAGDETQLERILELFMDWAEKHDT